MLMLFFFGALPIDTLKIKHTKKLKEIPSRHFLEKLPEKASMYAFIRLKIIGNLQGFCQYIMADMLNLTIADYRKYSAVVFLGSKNSFFLSFHNFPHTLIYQGVIENCQKS